MMARTCDVPVLPPNAKRGGGRVADAAELAALKAARRSDARGRDGATETKVKIGGHDRASQSMRQEADAKLKQAQTIVTNANTSRMSGPALKRAYAEADALRGEAKDLRRDADKLTLGGVLGASSSVADAGKEVDRLFNERDALPRDTKEWADAHAKARAAYDNYQTARSNASMANQASLSSIAASGPAQPVGTSSVSIKEIEQLRNKAAQLDQQAELTNNDDKRKALAARAADTRSLADAKERRMSRSGGVSDQPRVPAGEPDGGQWTKA